MTSRYLLASQSQVMWGDEGATPYTKASTLNKPFGLVGEDVDFPAINPRSPRATAGGGRTPHLFSQDEFDLSFGVGFEILNDAVPFMCAIGTDSALSGTGYTGTRFTASDRLETVSVRHEQKDGALQDDFVGCKADLMLSGKRGEAVKAQMDFLAASRDTNDACVSFTTVTVPTTQPFRFWMLGAVTLNNGAGGIDATLASINSFDIGWKNGLSPRGNAGDGSRGAYCIVEEEAEGRYDAKLGVTVVDNSLFSMALDGDVDIDVVIPLLRNGTSIANSTDCMLIYLNDCVILDATMPHKAKGDLQSEITLGVKSSYVDIRTPTA